MDILEILEEARQRAELPDFQGLDDLAYVDKLVEESSLTPFKVPTSDEAISLRLFLQLGACRTAILEDCLDPDLLLNYLDQVMIVPTAEQVLAYRQLAGLIGLHRFYLAAGQHFLTKHPYACLRYNHTLTGYLAANWGDYPQSYQERGRSLRDLALRPEPDFDYVSRLHLCTILARDGRPCDHHGCPDCQMGPILERCWLLINHSETSLNFWAKVKSGYKAWFLANKARLITYLLTKNTNPLERYSALLEVLPLNHRQIKVLLLPTRLRHFLFKLPHLRSCLLAKFRPLTYLERLETKLDSTTWLTNQAVFGYHPSDPRINPNKRHLNHKSELNGVLGRPWLTVFLEATSL